MGSSDPFAHLLGPFARVHGSNEMSDVRADWQRRREITALLRAIQQAAMDAECDLDWQRLAPERSEQEARPHLIELQSLVQQLCSPPSAL